MCISHVGLALVRSRRLAEEARRECDCCRGRLRRPRSRFDVVVVVVVSTSSSSSSSFRRRRFDVVVVVVVSTSSSSFRRRRFNVVVSTLLPPSSYSSSHVLTFTRLSISSGVRIYLTNSVYYAAWLDGLMVSERDFSPFGDKLAGRRK